MTSRTKQVKEHIKSIRRKSIYKLIKDGSVASYKRRIQKEKDELAKEGKGLRNIAFFLTLISMMLALSFIPFFPQPLPILISVLVAFLVYVNPAIGMSLGSIPIVIGLLYHLSIVDFIAMLGIMAVRVLFICLLIFFFVALPIRFRRYEDAIGINLGIISAALLFFDATYFLAIPLLLTVAILFKKTQAGLGVSYYVLISVPLMILQYFQHILTISRIDFWNDISSVPPIYVSLSGVFNHIQGAMVQFRMFDVSTTLGKILWNVVEIPAPTVHTVSQAITQYLDSFPGMILFLIMIAGIVWAVSLILPSLVSKSSINRAETLFPVLTSAGVTALFFIFMAGLQIPLAFSVKISSIGMMIGIFASLLFAIPAAMLNFAPKKKAEVEKNCKIILVKSGGLMTKLTVFEALLAKVKSTVPIDVSAPETKLKIIKEKLLDILANAETRKFKVAETYQVIKELDADLADGINQLSEDLNIILEHYQLNLNYSYTNWLKKLQEVGYEVKNPVLIEFQKDQLAEVRVEYINALLGASRLLGNDVCLLVEQIYNVIQSTFDSSLPMASRTVSYSKQKLAENTAPWVACDALVIALKNWAKQYQTDISKTVTNLRESLGSLANLNFGKTSLQAALGQKYPSFITKTSQANEMQAKLQLEKINILNLVFLKDALHTSLNIAREVLFVLSDELSAKEKSIENLLPIESNFWEKNVSLREQTSSSIEKISDSKQYRPQDMLRNLPEALSLIEPCLWTIIQYNSKNELLLNYPIAKTAIEDQLRKKKRISIQDLPFKAEDAEEYLKMFFNERSDQFTFDETTVSLSRKS